VYGGAIIADTRALTLWWILRDRIPLSTPPRWSGETARRERQGIGTPRSQVSCGHRSDPASAASTILTAARTALGGDQKLADIRTFAARGRTRQVRGNNLVPIEFEIWCELPDKYVRRDDIPAQESGPTSTGFSGDNKHALVLPLQKLTAEVTVRRDAQVVASDRGATFG
jgi:hypothetical protein